MAQLETLGKNLDQSLLAELADLCGQFAIEENEDEEEGFLVKKWQNITLQEIINNVKAINDDMPYEDDEQEEYFTNEIESIIKKLTSQ